MSKAKCQSTEGTDPTHVSCTCLFRCVDNGVGVGVWRQLQRRTDQDAAVRLVVLAGRGRRYHVPTERHLHGVRVQRCRQQDQVVGGRTHPQAPGTVRCLATS